MSNHAESLAELHAVYNDAFDLLRQIHALGAQSLVVALSSGERAFCPVPNVSRFIGPEELTLSYLRLVVDVVADELGGDRGLTLPDVDALVAKQVEDFRWSNRASAEPVDLLGFADLLRASYGASADRLANEQAADAFVRAFNISSTQEPVFRGGRVILNVHAYVSDFTKKWHGRNEFGNSGTIMGAARALGNAIRASGASGGEQAVVDAEAFVAAGNRMGWSCERTGYPNIGPVAVRAFQTKVEFHVPVELVATINLWASQHATSFRVATAA